MIILIFIIIILVALIAIALYLHFSKKSEPAYDPERVKLERENELYSLFDAFKERKLLVCNVRECGYFEQSQYEPDILLADFIYHFHPELLENEWENYTPKYFKRLVK